MGREIRSIVDRLTVFTYGQFAEIDGRYHNHDTIIDLLYLTRMEYSLEHLHNMISGSRTTLWITHDENGSEISDVRRNGERFDDHLKMNHVSLFRLSSRRNQREREREWRERR